jgi:hypothetical protein
MSKNRGKSKLSNNVLFNANKHVFHCEKSLGTLFYGQPCIIIWGDCQDKYIKTDTSEDTILELVRNI